MNDSVTIATSNPRSVLSGYQLHDNFSLTINNIQPSDSSTSYRCSVTIDDPRIPGTHDVVYDQSQLGLITVMVYGESLNKYTDMPFSQVAVTRPFNSEVHSKLMQCII